MPIEKLRPDFRFTKERLDQLQALVPETFADGRINWVSLQQALGIYLGVRPTIGFDRGLPERARLR